MLYSVCPHSLLSSLPRPVSDQTIGFGGRDAEKGAYTVHTRKRLIASESHVMRSRVSERVPEKGAILAPKSLSEIQKQTLLFYS